MPKTLVYGNEPYLLNDFRRKVKERIEVPEMNFWDTEVFTEEEQRFICQVPLFGGKKALFYSFKTMSDCLEAVDYVQGHGKSTEVYFFPKDVDKRTKAYRAFKKEEIHICSKLSQDKLEKTILQYVKKSDCQIAVDAYQLYLQVINYHSDETNLYDVFHSLERLCSVKQITKKIVESMVVSHEQESIFSLVKLIDQGSYADMFHQADLILRRQENNVIGVLSLLLRSYRLTYKMSACRCSLKDLGVTYGSYTPRLSAEQSSLIMNIINNTINKMKRGYYKPDTALKTTLARIAAVYGEG